MVSCVRPPASVLRSRCVLLCFLFHAPVSLTSSHKLPHAVHPLCFAMLMLMLLPGHCLSHCKFKPFVTAMMTRFWPG
jgi:hypothetical protein